MIHPVDVHQVPPPETQVHSEHPVPLQQEFAQETAPSEL